MLKYLVGAIALIYLACLVYFRWNKPQKTQKVLLIITKNLAAQNLEWCLFSFKGFIKKNLAKPDWWVYAQPEQAEQAEEAEHKKDKKDKEQEDSRTKLIVALSRRFKYRIVDGNYKAADYAYVFVVESRLEAGSWQQELNRQRGS